MSSQGRAHRRSSPGTEPADSCSGSVGGEFIEAGTRGLKSRPVSLPKERLKAAQGKIRDLSMQGEILQEHLKKGALATAADARGLLIGEDRSSQPVKLVCLTRWVAGSGFYTTRKSEEGDKGKRGPKTELRGEEVLTAIKKVLRNTPS